MELLVQFIWLVFCLSFTLSIILSDGYSADLTLRNAGVPCAQKISKGDVGTTIAVIDTGVDYLSVPNLLTGWNFVTNSSDTSDFHGHGTHVAGIIRHIAPKAPILPIRFYSEHFIGNQNTRNLVLAIDYAVFHKAKIINISGGGGSFDDYELAALKRAQEADILIVVAAGNERSDSDTTDGAFYPCSYELQNMICVAALAENGMELTRFSNWGPKKVALAAPGENVYSSLPGNTHGIMSGTSQATATVTGIAALVMDKHPQALAVEIKRLILESTDALPALKNKVFSGGRVNACRALKNKRK